MISYNFNDLDQDEIILFECQKYSKIYGRVQSAVSAYNARKRARLIRTWYSDESDGLIVEKI